MKIASVGNSHFQATIFLVVLIVAFATRHPVLMAGYVLLALCAVMTNLRVFSHSSVKERNAAVLIVSVLTIMLPLSVVKSETAIIHYIGSLISLSAAFVLTRNLETYLAASRLSLVAAQIAVFAYLFRTGLADFPLDNMLPDSSSNGVTSYLVLLQANYCVVNYLLTRRTSLLTAALTLVICLVGYARGSIISAAGVIVIGLLSHLPSRTCSGVGLRLLLVAFLGAAAYSFGEIVSGLVDTNTKLGSGLFDLHRYTIMSEYLQKIDAATIWSGASYDGTSIASQYNGNPHNSYIRAHHIFGLPYLMLILLLPIYLFHRRHAFSVRVYALGMWAVVLFRSLTEPVLFPTLFDFFFFATCFALGTKLPQVQHRRSRTGGSAAGEARIMSPLSGSGNT